MRRACRFEILEQTRIAAASIEQRDLMSAGLQCLDEVRPEEAGAAEDQHAQFLALAALGKGTAAGQGACGCSS
jgi:hypothetical protein